VLFLSAVVFIALTAVATTYILFFRGTEQNIPLTTAQMLDLGDKYLLELNYEQALVQFLGVIEIEPRNARSYIGAAEAYIGLDDKDNAVSILQQGLSVIPDNDEIQAMLDSLLVQVNTIVFQVGNPNITINDVVTAINTARDAPESINGVMMLPINPIIELIYGKSIEIPTIPTIYNSIPYAPIQDFAEFIDGELDWDDNSSHVILTYVGRPIDTNSLLPELTSYDLFEEVLIAHSYHAAYNAAGIWPTDIWSPDDAELFIAETVPYFSYEYSFYDIDGNGVAELFILIHGSWDGYLLVYAFAGGSTHLVSLHWSRAWLYHIDEQVYVYKPCR
jgi:tetratricopeptide (TPR) repeat protein